VPGSFEVRHVRASGQVDVDLDELLYPDRKTVSRDQSQPS
jgi:hypothetical protein